MDRLETLVREALETHAPEAPSPDGLLQAVEQHRPHRPWIAAVAAAVLVLAVAAGVIAFRNTDRGPSTGPSPVPTTTAPSVPPGYRAVSSHGVTVDVPAALKTVTSSCTQVLQDDLVTLDNRPLPCPELRPQRVQPVGTVVWLTDANNLRHLATVATMVDGQAARRGYGETTVNYGQSVPVGVVALTDPQVVVAVTAPDRAGIDTVLDSIRITPVDAVGCAAQISNLSPRGNAAADRLVPGTPTSVVRCSYQTEPSRNGQRWLLGSARFGASTATSVAQALDALVPTHLDPEPSESLGHADFWVFGFADGSHRTLAIRATGGTTMTVTDGERTAYDSAFQILNMLGPP